eukprot:gene6797-12371_t
MTRLSEFIEANKPSRYRLKSANIESKVKKMALERYQELKDSTKTELIQSLDDLMSGETKVCIGNEASQSAKELTQGMKKKSEFHVVELQYLFEYGKEAAFTSDPNWPAVTLSGSLPQLIVNVDEHKAVSITSQRIITFLQENLPSRFISTTKRVQDK